jgi:integrase
MSNFLDKLQTAYKIAYNLKSENQMVKKYSKPKIYHGGKTFDLTKRWYIYYEYQHPTEKDKAGRPKMQRQTPITLGANRNYKTKKDRLHYLHLLRDVVEKMLKDGFNPYQDNITIELYSVNSAIEYALSLKKKAVGKQTYRGYESIAENFKTYLKAKGKLNEDVKRLDKRTVNDFLNQKLKETTPATRNSYRTGLSAIFQVLEDNDFIERNFIKNIKPLKTNPERNKTYNLEKVNDIYEYLEESEPALLLLIKFVSYNFLRPIEACRLQVKDLELSNKPPVLKVRAKNKPVKTKIIPDVMVEELNKLDLTNPNAFLITHEGVAESNTSAEDRRGHFTKRYKKVKDKLGLGDDYTIYSFRHTFITKLYREFRKTYGQFETYDKLMLITGHSTLKALQKYLRDIDAELPEDYSKHLKP